jgi:hypothetical protein
VMANIALPLFREVLERRQQAIAHPSWILGVKIDKINWHMPALIGNRPVMQEVFMPYGVARDPENLERLQQVTSREPLLQPDPNWERSPTRQRGVRFHRAQTFENLMGIYEAADDYSTEVLDIPVDALPEAGLQANSIEAMHHGWLVSHLMATDYNLWGRWFHWQSLYLDGALEKNERIPQMPFNCDVVPRVQEIMDHWLDQIDRRWRTNDQIREQVVHYLMRYLLWAFGHCSEPVKPFDHFDGRVHDRLSQVVPPLLRQLFLYPAAHFSSYLGREMLGHRTLLQNRANSLAKSMFPGRRNDYREAPLILPEIDGSAVLAASNHTYEIHGLSTDPWRARAALLDAYLFAPWFVFPFKWMTDFAWNDGGYETANLLQAVGRTHLVMQSQKLSEDWFSKTEPSQDAPDLRPIELRERKQNDLLDGDASTDPGVEALAAMFAGAPILKYPVALPTPPSTALQLPSSTDLQELLGLAPTKKKPPLLPGLGGDDPPQNLLPGG